MDASIRLAPEHRKEHLRILHMVRDNSDHMKEVEIKQRIHNFLSMLRHDPEFLSVLQSCLRYTKYASRNIHSLTDNLIFNIGIEFPFLTDSSVDNLLGFFNNFAHDFTIAYVTGDIFSSGPLRHLGDIMSPLQDEHDRHRLIRMNLMHNKNTHDLITRDDISFFILLDGSVVMLYPNTFATYGAPRYAPFSHRRFQPVPLSDHLFSKSTAVLATISPAPPSGL